MQKETTNVSVGSMTGTSYLFTKKKTSALDSIADVEFEEAQNVVLEGIGTMMAEKVIVGGIGAILTSDPEVGGYYLVSWDSPPYTLQEDMELTEYDLPVLIPAGELVASAMLSMVWLILFYFVC
jgi:hypothetical protein